MARNKMSLAIAARYRQGAKRPCSHVHGESRRHPCPGRAAASSGPHYRAARGQAPRRKDLINLGISAAARTREPHTFRVSDDPVSAAHRCASLHAALRTGNNLIHLSNNRRSQRFAAARQKCARLKKGGGRAERRGCVAHAPWRAMTLHAGTLCRRSAPKRWALASRRSTAASLALPRLDTFLRRFGAVRTPIRPRGDTTCVQALLAVRLAGEVLPCPKALFRLRADSEPQAVGNHCLRCRSCRRFGS